MSRTGTTRDEAPRAAFTLIELLVTVSIIMILISTLIVATMAVRKKTLINRTKGIIVTLQTGMARYVDVYQEYPPDGHDGTVVAYGEKISGSQCLVWHLMRPLTVTKRRGTREYQKGIDPMIPPGEFPAKALEWAINDMLEKQQVPTIQDGFDSPLQYDRTSGKGEFTFLGNDGHEDPRGDVEDDVTIEMGPYQIWSRGPNGRGASGDTSDDLKSWEIR